MKIVGLIGIGFMMVLSIFSCKKEETVNSVDLLNDVDRKFIQKASAYDSAEIRTAQLALTKVDSVYMIAYAQTMLTEHTNALRDLRIMGNVVGFNVKDTISNASLVQIAYLNTLSDSTFDSTYLHTRVMAKPEVEAIYEEEIANGSQKNVKNYANYYLQLIRQQINRADSIRYAYYR